MDAPELFNLSGRCALVTGGGRGLGRIIAFALAQAGANVAVASRNEEVCADVAREIAETTGRVAISSKLDVSEKSSVQEAVRSTKEKLGSIDILVNNSGRGWGAPLEEMPLEKWEMTLSVNLTGTFLMCQSVVPLMKERRWGRIINVSSVAGLHGTPPFMPVSGYVASKGGIISLTRDLAVKLAEYNIVVNAIAPSFFPTDLNKVLLDKYGEQIKQRNPMKRIGEDDDLKGVVVFLASEASRYVTGQVIPIDGGVTAA